MAESPPLEDLPPRYEDVVDDDDDDVEHQELPINQDIMDQGEDEEVSGDKESEEMVS